MVQVVEVKSQEHLDKLFEQYDRVIVDFYADWCAPCRDLKGKLEELANATQLNILKVNVDELPDVAGEFGIMGIPTLVLVEKGVAVKTVKANNSGGLTRPINELAKEFE